MNRFFRRGAAAAVAVMGLTIGLTGTASAAPIGVDAGWASFGFGEQGSAGAPGYEFTATSPVIVTVTDYQCIGDEFTVSDNGTTLGSTSDVEPDDCAATNNDPSSAYASGAFSSGQWLLPAGNHSLTFVASASPYFGGYGAVQVATATTALCDNDGGAQFGFANRGDCVSFIATKGKNGPKG